MMHQHKMQKMFHSNTSLAKQSGGSTIEFAMVVLPMTLLFVVFFEFVVLMWSQMIFSSAVQVSARQIRVLPPSAAADVRFAGEIADFPLLKAEQLLVQKPFYAETIADLVRNKSAAPDKVRLAQYQVSYQYQFFILPFVSEQLPELFSFNKSVLVNYDR